jgi:hypothetical protein
MRWRRRSLVIAVLAASVAVATPVLAHMAFGGGGGDLGSGVWENAVVLFDEDVDSATVVVIYDAGERDTARRLEVEQQQAPGVTITVGLLFEQADDGLIRAVSDIRCVKARVRGLRPPQGGPALVLDRDESKIEGRGLPNAGFALPPLSECRTIEADVLGN